jgi:spore maturation protein CgeB
MRFVIFGLTITSSWGNGHATLWRALAGALAADGHHVTFFERDVPYYAKHRDLAVLAGCDVRLYTSWHAVLPEARASLDRADVGMVTSYCPDGVDASRLVLGSRAPRKVFYDLDTPVTLERLERGERVEYLPHEGLADFDLVLSFTGGRALDALAERLGARRVAPLYGSVDPLIHRPGALPSHPGMDLSYLGTYADDRQPTLAKLFLHPARLEPQRRFLLGGSMYPKDFPWVDNIWYVPHVAPGEHRAFFASARLTLNVTRRAMATMGYCPSGRLFEAAACGVPLLSDAWEGLDSFYSPGEEILIADDTDDALEAIDATDEQLRRIAQRALERTLDEHTATRRARTMIELVCDPPTSPAIEAPLSQSVA